MGKEVLGSWKKDIGLFICFINCLYYLVCLFHSSCEHFSTIEDLCILVGEDQKHTVQIIVGGLNGGVVNIHYVLILFTLKNE